MLNRFLQVWSALTACINEEDKLFVEQYLSVQEQMLFWGMSLPDQRHALNVAHTAQRLANEQSGVDKLLLTRCALLHDVGRRNGDVSTGEKIAAVLLDALVPRWSKSWGREGSQCGFIDHLRHALYVYYHHPERGVELLQPLGVETILLLIIAIHHNPSADADPPELHLLQQADQMH